ncbi:MAG: 2-hydroxyacyl-CoA dehydratase family protein [bacterium]
MTFDEWLDLFERVPDETIERYHYYRAHQSEPAQWSAYLFPPQTFAVYGCRHLRRLKFDNSLAALRMWGFIQNETERLFRARQLGFKVIATMGDLGAVPVIASAFPGCIAFYPDCTWWTPFVMESNVLFDAAAELGIGEATCFSRAALGAFAKHSYFPDPDLVIASTGATCDDYSGVESRVATLVPEMLWVEVPMRADGRACHGCSSGRATTTDSCTEYDPAVRELLVQEYRRVVARLETLTGHRLTEADLDHSIALANRVRTLTRELSELAYGKGALPALEMMAVEFGCLHGYSDFAEWCDILEHLLDTARRRVEAGDLPLDSDALRIAWSSPPADPLFLCHVEDLGCRVVATEYLINQALEEIAEGTEWPRDRENEKPDAVVAIDNRLSAIAESFMAASLIGSSRQRAATFIRRARARGAEGVVVSGVLGGSHCAMESRPIAEEVRAGLGVPLLEFDVLSPAREVNRQIATRIEAFVEVLRGRRGAQPAGARR